MKHILPLVTAIILLFTVTACNGEETMKTTGMILAINETEVPVTWEDNPSVQELEGLLPLTVSMSMYGGFEQVGPLGQRIASSDVQTDTDPGDIVLYASSQIVIFYGSNSWAYTRLGHIDMQREELEELLGKGNVSITLSAAEE